jgi:D-alanine-D-alanine ligase
MELKRARVGVLMGGLSAEREVSLRSGENVYQALVRRGYQAERVVIDDPDELFDRLTGIEVAFLCLHGGIGEDGTIQLLLELMGIPYTGSGPLASALAMDKLAAKKAFKKARLPTALHLEYRGESWDEWAERVSKGLGFPCVIKPLREGSTLGVHIVQDAEGLIKASKETQKKYREFFVERYIPGVEVTTGTLRVEGEERALIPIELRPKSSFYDYKAKYTPGMTEFIIPADLDEKTLKRVQELTLKAHKALGCFGFSRVDLRVTAEGEIFLLEVNTLPGMTETSDLPKSAAAAGISFDELVELMLQTAVEGDG